jgi:hypothetical protein
MPGHSSSKNGVASLAYVPGIHVLRGGNPKHVDGRAFARRRVLIYRAKGVSFGPQAGQARP